MKLTYTMYTLLALYAQGLAYATARGDDAVFADEADFVTAEWEVEVTPGGDLVTLYGSVEDVVEQLRELNPNWDTDFPEVEEPEDSANTFEAAVEEDEDHSLVERTDFGGSEYGCTTGGSLASVYRIEQGISYLRRISGNPRMGNNQCSRVSCSYGAGIAWCNRSGGSKTLNTFGSIADGAKFLVPRCHHSSTVEFMSGWVKHKSKWNVKVYYTSC